MPSDHLPARKRALQYIRDALDTGVRGPLRDALLNAEKLAKGERASDLNDLDYRQAPDGAKIVDPDRPGLLMRKGKRAGDRWIYRYAHPETGKQTELQFGRYPELSLADARTAWADLRNQRAMGEAPKLAGQQAASGSTITLGALVRRYLNDYAKKRKRSWQQDQTLLERYVLPGRETLAATDFDARELALILNPLRERAPRQAELVRAVVSTMFEVATARSRRIDRAPGSNWIPTSTPNPAKEISYTREKVQAHKPKQRELGSYIRGLPALGQIGDLLRIQIETCARINEVCGLRWDELDGDVWVLPSQRSKNGEEHRVMLAPSTLALIEAQPRVGPYVFPSATVPQKPTRSDHVIHTLARNRDKLGVDGRVTSHAIRHACLTWMAESGAGKEIRDRISNHKPPASTDDVYVAASRDGAAREWLLRWVDHLSGLADDQVVQLGERRA